MCNEVARRIALGQLREDFSQLKIRLVFPEGAPNMAPLDSVRITDATVIIRSAAAEDEEDRSGTPQNTTLQSALISRRWSWPGAGGRPVYNYRSDGRALGNNGAKGGRCMIPVDSFFEFTAPADGAKGKRKDKWRFAAADHDWFCIAGLWRAGVTLKSGETGEAFTMLTCPPGPDVAPYHARQVVVLDRADYAGWLDGSVPSADLCRPAPAGTLRVEHVR